MFTISSPPGEEKNVSGLDYNKFIYIDENNIIKVKPSLIKLLALTAPSDFVMESKYETLAEFVKVTQNPPVSWIRPSGVTRSMLFSAPLALDEQKKSEVLDVINMLKLFERNSSTTKIYDGAVILGTSTRLDKRFFELQNILMTGVKIKNIFLMGASEDITYVYKSILENIILEYPDRFKETVKVPDRLTEHETMIFYINNLKWPENFKDINVIALPSLRKQGDDGRSIKPTTQDELNTLTNYINDNLSINKGIELHLAIMSNPPFSYRQNLVFQQLNKLCHIETLAGGDKAKNVIIALDELSRLCYQLNQFLKSPENIKAINLISLHDPLSNKMA